MGHMPLWNPPYRIYFPEEEERVSEGEDDNFVLQ